MQPRRSTAAPLVARPTRQRRRLLFALPLLLLLAGCGDPTGAGRLGFPKPITEQGHRVLRLWVGSTWAAIVVGALVYGLILWACVRFRKRSEEMPRQIHYNLPVETLYTLLPLVIIGVLFYYTARDESYLDKVSANPDVRVGVVGFQWSWQFNYPQADLQVTGRTGQDPTLVLPAHRTVLFTETSPDVIHSFWVPSFLFKRDVVPGRHNQFQIRTETEGTYVGRCAEYCGLYHSQMLFTVKVVSPAAYQRFLTSAHTAAVAGTSDKFSTTGTVTPAEAGGKIS